MTPIRLVIQAFGPFSRKTVVDFRELGDRGMFLITGPTGAGKTTLLDAVTFALFGESSGRERKPHQMRSQHADPGLATEVTFDFSLAGEVYRVTRRPQQDRPAKRGSGVVTEQPHAMLWRRTGLRDDAQEGDVLAARPTEVDSRVEQILGFSGDQFRQVVLLPQGQFRRFLEASSAEREEILEALFRTEDFHRVEQALQEKAKELEARLKALAAEEDALLRNAPARTREELEAKSMLARDRAAAEGSRVAELRVGEANLERRIRDARETEAKFSELDSARAGLALAEFGAQENSARQEALRRARIAAPLAPLEAQAAERGAEADRALSASGTAAAACEAALHRRAEAERVLLAEEGRQAERHAAQERVRELQGLIGTVRELEGLRARERSLVAARDGASRRRAAAEARAKDCREAAERKNLEAAAAESESQLESTLRSLVEEADRKTVLRKKLEAARAIIPGKRHVAQAAEGTVARALAELDRGRSRLASMEEAWSKGQAAILAVALASGEPCLVCGSREHPDPARPSGAMPDQNDLKACKTTASDLQAALDKGREEFRSAAAALERAEAEARAVYEALGADAQLGASDLEKRAADFRFRLANASKAAARLPALRKELQVLQAAQAGAMAEAEASLTAYEFSAKECEGVQAIVRDREGSVPPAFLKPGVAEAELRRAEARMAELTSQVEAARKSAEAVRVEAARAEEAVERAKEASERAEALAREAGLRLSAAMERAGFESCREFEQARRSDEDVQELEASTKRFEAELLDARGRLGRAERTVAGLVRIDPLPIERERDGIRAERDAALREEAAARAEEAEVTRVLSGLAGIRERKAMVESQFAVYGRLAQVATGSNPLRINFQRFVLRSLLQDVLVAASSRLRLMSHGRYNLQVASQPGGGRGAAGLELEVADALTGGTRPVTTLSGGEGFLASLSLALGLADVVQARAGGVRLDAVFVDEGFGTLDEELLELAIRVLTDLRQGGRMVGIISHVQELKERIGTRLEVVGGPETSSARFVL